jgi:hypothetical protein
MEEASPGLIRGIGRNRQRRDFSCAGGLLFYLLEFLFAPAVLFCASVESDCYVSIRSAM